MSSGTDLSRLLRDEITKQIDLFQSLWDGYSGEVDPETPHRQRTAVNRLMGYSLFLGIDTGDKSREGKALRKLRAWQKHIGPLRDLDITRDWLKSCRKKAAEGAVAAADQLDKELAEKRLSLIADIRLDRRGIAGAETRVALREIAHILEAALAKLEAKDAVDSRATLRSVWKPWRKELAALHEGQTDEALHEFRVRNKRYRFVVEVLADAEGESELGAKLAARAEILARIHTTLGNLSDLAVLKDLLRIKRARWIAAGLTLDDAAEELERSRCGLELAELREWYAIWPLIATQETLREPF